MANCLGKGCSFGLLYVFFMNVYQFVSLLLSLFILRVGCGMWDLIVSVPDHCLTINFNLHQYDHVHKTFWVKISS